MSCYRRQRVFLLLDGLSEMSYQSENLSARFDLLQNFVQGLPAGNRLIVSCRSSHVVKAFSGYTANINELSTETVLTRINEQIRTIAIQAAQRIQDAFKEAYVVDFYKNPLRLSLFLETIDELGIVPVEEAHLFSRVILTALLKHQKEDSDAWKRIRELCSEAELNIIYQHTLLPTPHQETASSLIGSLGHLAMKLQKEGAGEWAQPTDKHIEGILGSRWKIIVESAVDLGILQRLEKVGEQVTRWRYSHHLLQEYFAARAWVRDAGREGGAFAQRPYRIDDAKLVPSTASLYAEGLNGKRLPHRTISGWEKTISMAMTLTGTSMRFIEELLPFDPVSVGSYLLNLSKPKDEATDEQTADFYKYQSALRELLVGWLNNPEVDLRAKIEAGCVLDAQALSLLGYKKGQTLKGYTYWLPPCIKFVGSNTFELSKYQLTYAEYDCFVVAGGYLDSRYWPETTGAKAWLDANAQKRIESWQVTEALQPVVGICYYEIAAYVAWLSRVSSRSISIPSKLQWDVVLQDIDITTLEPVYQHANVIDSGLQRSVPISTYTTVRDGGVNNIFGNVQEYVNGDEVFCRGIAWNQPVSLEKITSVQRITADSVSDYVGARIALTVSNYRL